MRVNWFATGDAFDSTVIAFLLSPSVSLDAVVVSERGLIVLDSISNTRPINWGQNSRKLCLPSASNACTPICQRYMWAHAEKSLALPVRVSLKIQRQIADTDTGVCVCVCVCNLSTSRPHYTSRRTYKKCRVLQWTLNRRRHSINTLTLTCIFKSFSN